MFSLEEGREIQYHENKLYCENISGRCLYKLSIMQTWKHKAKTIMLKILEKLVSQQITYIKAINNKLDRCLKRTFEYGKYTAKTIMLK